jgi:hypothetical protein
LFAVLLPVSNKPRVIIAINLGTNKDLVNDGQNSTPRAGFGATGGRRNGLELISTPLPPLPLFLLSHQWLAAAIGRRSHDRPGATAAAPLHGPSG